ncbi:hypothetical protein DV737_g1250, partial [Chaetothyriales sp. CBS 132003]
MDQQRFLQQLEIVLDPKKGDVRTATGILQNEFYKQPAALLFLIQLVVSSNSQELKQLAATQARPLVSKFWTKLPAEQRQQVRSQLFQATLAEESPLPRHAASRIISAIAKIDLEDGEWQELPGLLHQAATSPKASDRVVGVYVLYSILEVMGDGFANKFKELFKLFSSTIKDPESLQVRVNTVLAVSKMAVVIDAEEDQQSVKAFQALFPSMVKVLQDAIESGNDDQAMLVFEVFNTLLSAEYQLLATHFNDLVVFMNGIASNKEMKDDTRTQAISFLMQAVMFRRLRVQGAEMGEPLTKSMLQIVTELDDEAPDADDITPARSALGLIDTLAQSLPAKQVTVPLLQALPTFSKSLNPAYRRAGILALGQAVEGAPEFLSTQMSIILPILYKLLEDPEVAVRRAALQTCARLADDLPEQVTKEHEKLMPLLLKNITSAMSVYKGEEEGPAIDIMRSGASAVDSVVDGMESEAASKYLDQLAPLLQKLFKHPDFKVKALAAGALGSLASTVKAPFFPYLQDSMNAMQEYITKKESEEELDLRAACIDSMGEMAVAVGPADFKNYVRPLMQASEEALKLDHSRLKESTYILWGSLAKVYEEDFSPFLNGVVKGLFECIDQEEADLEVELGDQAKDLLDLAAVTPIAMEKEIAIEVVGDVVGNTKTAFLPYFERTIQKLLPLVEHDYENVRKAAISTLHRAYIALFEISEESGQMEKWKPGLPLQIEPTAELKKLGELLMTATLNIWPEEDDPATTSEISRILADNLKLTGPNLLSYPEVLQKTGMDDEDLDDEDLESNELEWVVIDNGMDVISGLAAALGSSFAELWKIFEKQVLKFASGPEPTSRASACGVLAEVITGMDGAVTPYTATLMTILLKRLSDEDAQTKSNAAYAIGRLVEKSNDNNTVFKAYPQILSKLENVLGIKEARCTDNAAGCVARLILKHKDHVPIADVLPALVSSGVLPLEDDYQENEPVWTMIINLYKENDPTVQGLTKQLAPIMISVLGEPEEQLTDEVRSELQALVEHLKKTHG